MKIKRIGHDENVDQNILIYGAPGSGKTPLLCTAPSALILNVDKGMVSVTDPAVEYVDISSEDDMREIIEFLKNSKDATKYQNVCLDSFSELNDTIFRSLANAKNTRSAYFDCQNITLDLLYQLKNIKGKNFIASCEMKVCSEDIYDFRPYANGNTLTITVPHKFNQVLCLLSMTTEEGEKIPYLYSSDELNDDGNHYLTRDRSGKLRAREKSNLKSILKRLTK